MQSEHVRVCVEIVAANPWHGPRYGKEIFQLAEIWTSLLGSEAFRAVVFEEVNGTNVEVFGCGVSAFVSDEYVRDLKTPPLRWIGPDLARKFAAGESPLLSDKQVRESNSTGGLNVVLWDGCVRPEDVERPEVGTEIVEAFVEQHRGFRLKEYLSQALFPEAGRNQINAAAPYLDPVTGRYVDAKGLDGMNLYKVPNVFGMTREMALGSAIGSWISALFIYQSPQMDLRPSEQRLLLSAMAGGTDEDLAEDLGVSVSRIKKTWASIYDRAAAQLPGLVPGNMQWGDPARRRGQEKKQRLLAYVREHPEELRPASHSRKTRPGGAPSRRVRKYSSTS